MLVGLGHLISGLGKIMNQLLKIAKLSPSPSWAEIIVKLQSKPKSKGLGIIFLYICVIAMRDIGIYRVIRE